jgi:hypothetical protein
MRRSTVNNSSRSVSGIANFGFALVQGRANTSAVVDFLYSVRAPKSMWCAKWLI